MEVLLHWKEITENVNSWEGSTGARPGPRIFIIQKVVYISGIFVNLIHFSPKKSPTYFTRVNFYTVFIMLKIICSKNSMHCTMKLN